MLSCLLWASTALTEPPIVVATDTGWTVISPPEQAKCPGKALKQGQTIEAPCKGFFVPEKRADDLLVKEAQLKGAQAKVAELQEENAQLEATAEKNKKKLMNRKLWKGVTIGQFSMAVIIIVVLAL